MSGLKHIVLVEDSKHDAELTMEALKEGQIANPVTLLRNGAEALAYLKKTEHADGALPVVVLLDIKMPKVSGIEVLRALKADEKLKRVPVVVLTSSKEGPDIEECYRLGANAYVVKPVTFDEFFKAIKDVGKFWAVVNQPPQIVTLAGPAEAAAKN